MIDWLGHNWLLVVVAVFVVLAALVAYQPEGKVAGRVYVRFVLFVALPLFFLALLWLALISALFPNLDDGRWAALIAGGVIAGGWLTTAIFAQLDRAQDKAERLRDIHKALFAEIRHSLYALYGNGQAEENAAALIVRMQDDDTFVPFIPKEHFDRVYLNVLDHLEVLPRETIDLIVGYYSQIAAIQAFQEDMRGARFPLLDQSRRIAMYEDYVDMRVRAYQLGTFALKVITAYADSGAQGARALSDQNVGHPVAAPLNTPDVDRFGQSQERE